MDKSKRPKFRSSRDIVYKKKNGRKTLGSGSFGNVRLVSHASDASTLYALKVMNIDDEVERKYIMQEIKLHLNFDNPYIIKMFDFFIEDGQAFVILEYAPRGDLFKYLHRTLFIPKSDLYRIFVQVLVAFEYLHSKNVLHRDLKPENILLDRDLNVKVCDFGWAAKYSDYETRETLCGTAEYMAPEIMYRKKQTKKTDVWALGRTRPQFAGLIGRLTIFADQRFPLNLKRRFETR